MEAFLRGLRAIGEASRLRLLNLLAQGELNVTEITQILGQSQPRISRHLKLMCDAGLLDRYREGSWVLFRLRESGSGAQLARAVVEMLPKDAAQLRRDVDQLKSVRDARAEQAQRYFRANAANWHELRSLHVSEQEVEAAWLKLIGEGRIGTLIDLGTGTGRVLEVLAPLARQAIGIDASREMLAIARANLERAQLRNAQVRLGDVNQLSLPDASADLVTIHQVLHYLDDPARALMESARILRQGGRLLVVDFAPHALDFLREEHAHRRLGIAADHMAGWLQRTGLELAHFSNLKPPRKAGKTGLTVSLWLAVKAEETIPRKRKQDAS
jgi:ubiquinone/menaquinone biosynthesis C-methylase UbiE/DNA-binding transcriptional ArsR family regulator